MTIGGENVSNVARRVAYPHALTCAKLGNAEMEAPGTRTWGNMVVRTGMNDDVHTCYHISRTIHTHVLVEMNRIRIEPLALAKCRISARSADPPSLIQSSSVS